LVAVRNRIYTKELQIKNHSIGILGINTAWLCEGDQNDRFQLTPGKAMLEDGLEKIKDCEVRIVLGHHPIDWFIENEASSLRALLAKTECSLFNMVTCTKTRSVRKWGREENF